MPVTFDDSAECVLRVKSNHKVSTVSCVSEVLLAFTALSMIWDQLLSLVLESYIVRCVLFF